MHFEFVLILRIEGYPIASVFLEIEVGKKSVITEATKLSDKSIGTKITMEYED